jgi:hypothetical protein
VARSTKARLAVFFNTSSSTTVAKLPASSTPGVTLPVRGLPASVLGLNSGLAGQYGTYGILNDDSRKRFAGFSRDPIVGLVCLLDCYSRGALTSSSICHASN